MIPVLYCDVIQTMIVDAGPESLVLLFHEEDTRTYRRGGTNYPANHPPWMHLSLALCSGLEMEQSHPFGVASLGSRSIVQL